MAQFLESISMTTPDGAFHIIMTSDSVAIASGYGDFEALRTRLSDDMARLPIRSVMGHDYETSIKDYYNGDFAALDTIPRSQSGTDFQKNVWNAIAAIPYGKTISYKELAHMSGNEAAVRAAGTVCGLNRLILLVPCHRVLKSDGGIGSYLYGAVIKESLLRREGSIT